MREKKIALLLAASLFLFSCGCSKDGNKVSSDDAKKAVSDYSPGAVITECEYDEARSAYVISFETDYGEYTATVDGENGKIVSVILTEPDPIISDSADKDDSKQTLTADDALAVAIMDADVLGSVMTVQNSYKKDGNYYYIIFRSGNKEFTYKVDAETGDILDSSVDMDS